jgi:hypothetical protein
VVGRHAHGRFIAEPGDAHTVDLFLPRLLWSRMRLSRWASAAALIAITKANALGSSSSVRGLQVRKDDGLQTNVCPRMNDVVLGVLLFDA